MKKLIFIILTLCLIGIACEEKNPKDVVYHKNIPFTEYSLENTSCKWKDFDSDAVILINSNEEMENYIDCTEGSYPVIDFSRNSLVLARGSEKGIYLVNNAVLLQNAVNKYTLEVTLRINPLAVMDEWTIACRVVPKMNNETEITLNVMHYPEGYPIDLPFEGYSLENTSCQWNTIHYDASVIVINSNEEMENYIDCTEGTYPEIDFSKYSLLLASGYESGLGGANATAYLQDSANKYTLEVTLKITAIAAMIEWDIAVLVHKIPNEANIVLTIKYKP